MLRPRQVILCVLRAGGNCAIMEGEGKGEGKGGDRMKRQYEFWFVVGSQFLYGEDALRTVEARAREMAAQLSGALPFPLVYKLTAKTHREIADALREANYRPECAGVVTWCHTFSPSRMWIDGLRDLQKPWCHLATQYNREIPNDEIDMDFMNENQSAHGDREYGHIVTRMGIERKVVAGHWQRRARAVSAWRDWMRTAVGTGGEPQGAASLRVGGQHAQRGRHRGRQGRGADQAGLDRWTPIRSMRSPSTCAAVSRARTPTRWWTSTTTCTTYSSTAATRRNSAAMWPCRREIELGFERFMVDRRTTTPSSPTPFGDLGAHQAASGPGQSSAWMAKGYGFGAEGDWKTAGDGAP